MAEAADLLRDARELDGDAVVLGREAGDELVHQRFVLRDETALDAALLAPAEGIERCEAQKLELREQAEGRHHPGTVAALLLVTGQGIALCQQRRRQMELEAEIAVELLREFLLERAVGVEP